MYFSVIVFYDCKILDMHESSRNRKLLNITQTLGGPRLNYVDCINICILVVIKISISHDEACEVAIGVIRIYKSKKDRQLNGQKKRTNNDLHNIVQKSQDRATRTPIKAGDELMYPDRENRPCSTCGTRRVILVTNPVISHEWGYERILFTTIMQINSNMMSVIKWYSWKIVHLKLTSNH